MNKLALTMSILGLLTLAACGGGAGGEVPVVGFLQITTNPTVDSAREGYLQALADAGFVDGETVHIILKDAQGDMSTAQLIARDFVNRRVDLIGTASTPALQSAMNATSEIPIVFSFVANPYLAGAGEAADNHLPNVTGVFTTSPVDRALALVAEIMPGILCVGTLYDPGEAFSEMYLEIVHETASNLGLEWVEIAVTSSTDIIPGVQALKSRGVEAILQIPGNLLDTGIDGEIREAQKLGIPLFSVHTNHVENGALAAIGWDFHQAGYDAGQVAARALHGENPANIPFQPVEKEVLYVNVETAKLFNITIPPAVLERADRVIGQEGG
jgi:putative ABC transport system substrate-binding protein